MSTWNLPSGVRLALELAGLLDLLLLPLRVNNRLVFLVDVDSPLRSFSLTGSGLSDRSVRPSPRWRRRLGAGLRGKPSGGSGGIAVEIREAIAPRTCH